MAKINISYPILVVIFTLLISTHTNAVNAKKYLDEDELCLKREKLAKIFFHAHDIAGGPNGTVYEIARASITTDDLFSFGRVQVFDGVMTEGPNRSSAVLGKVQGILTSADMKTTAMAMSFNVVFTTGEFNGSTVSVAGRNPVLEPLRRLAVVGGTGAFRFTRGYINVQTYSTSFVDSVFFANFMYTIHATYCPTKM
ncbi:dirigent protein 1-like [Salvia miltiorrhiza]|uniref:dirigent protein 1-like n=1 Tax=Salvia miltiorrhiza TaxID=226208 RepID=UPI0025AC2096|nr:dirigent protein 1-like [Salvia miltiorrhiza]